MPSLRRKPIAAAVAALAVAGLALAAPSGAASKHADLRLFPSDRLTVPDAGQLTHRRVNLPMPRCTAATHSDCDEVRLLNTLDGFDLDPRIEVAFGRMPDLSKVLLGGVFVQKAAGGPRITVNRLVWSPKRKVLYAHPTVQLDQHTTYRLVVDASVDGRSDFTTFTTLSATRRLEQMRQQLDDGSAYSTAKIGAKERGISFVQPGGARTVFASATVEPEMIMRHEDQGTKKGIVDERVLDSSFTARGTLAFGSMLVPQWMNSDRVIPATRTRTGAPKATHADRIEVIVQLPAGPAPAGGWPVAIYGAGISRSAYDSLLAADFNAARGIATVSIDPVGHAYGPKSTTTVATATGSVTFPTYGRGRDVTHDGVITNDEAIIAPVEPNPQEIYGLRDGLVQTAADEMSLVRAIERGVDVDGDGVPDLAKSGIGYYAESLGAIYGTMVAAVDPQLTFALLNVPGGPIDNIARLSPGTFREEEAVEFRNRKPSLANGGPNGFTDAEPLYSDPPLTHPLRGALAIEDFVDRIDWFNRTGSPEAYAPHLRTQPLAGNKAKAVLLQLAYGDKTVPNPTQATLMRAGGLRDVTTYYRNDMTPTMGSNPHGYLLDPTLFGTEQAQVQAVTFLQSKGATILDPDGPGPIFEVPITDPMVLEHLNFAPASGGTPPPPE